MTTVEEQRPTPLVEDLEATRARLADWFSERRGTRVEIPELQVPEATGMSNVTLLFDEKNHALRGIGYCNGI